MYSRYLRDPLCHFLLIGAALFGISAAFHSDTAGGEEIVINQNRIDHLAAVFARRWQRAPTAKELQLLVDNYVREEVLYREALNMGLDRDDTVVRRRLRMKMEFLAKDLVNAVKPEEEILRRYCRENADKYARPATLSFRQIYFSSDARDSATEDAVATLAQLKAGENPDKLGDSNLLQHRYAGESAGRIDRLFGTGFAAQLAQLPRQQWAGPVTSAYGEHLIYIENYRPAQAADFAAVRPQVLRDWQADEQKKILQKQYEALRSNYVVRIEGELPIAGGEVAVQ